MPQLHLKTFGGVSIVRDGLALDSAVTGWRRLACCALLAAEGGGSGVPRELLQECLWPDSASERARHSLHQLLYSLRRSLDTEDIVVGESLVRLNPARMTCDVWAAEEAMRAHDYERVVSLHVGPFAEGLHLPQADRAERCIAALQERLRGQHRKALNELANAAKGRQDVVECVRWRRALVAADPLSSNAAIALIEALVEAGEHTQALEFIQSHAKLIRRELECEADPRVLQWRTRLRADASVSRGIAPARDTDDALHTGVPSPPRGDDTALESQLTARLQAAVGASYEALQLIERGGLAARYSARRNRDGGSTSVELAIVHSMLAATLDRERFRDVMGRAAALSDHRALPIVDYEANAQIAFVATAPRVGRSLKEYRRSERQMPIPDTLHVARELAGLLSHAHANGVHHGDLRPKRIFREEQRLFVSGLGLRAAVAPKSDASHHSTVVTVGDPTYQSPEQREGHVVADQRSDIYAIGCIVFELLAGTPPVDRLLITRPTSDELATRLRHARPTVSASLASIICRCLEPVAVDRWPDCGQLEAALMALPESHSA